MKRADFEPLNFSGAVLSDRDMKAAIAEGLLRIDSPTELRIQPASLDVHLARGIAFFSRSRIRDAKIDLRRPVEDFMSYEDMDPNTGYNLHPREFILGVTRECFGMPPELCGSLDGKSSLARLGLLIHATGGFVDPGFKGHITLEMTNITERPITIYPYMPVGQMRFSVLSSPAEVVYGSPSLNSKQYRNPFSDDPKPKPSEYYKNFANLPKEIVHG